VPAALEFQDVSKHYPGARIPAVDRLSLRVEPGETCILVGPSGSGKTTAMRMVNRMVEMTSGDILIDGRSVGAGDPAELRRHIGYVIQHVGLFPHRTTLQNIGTVPQLLGWPKEKIAARARELVDLVGLDPDLAERYPGQLSGGQRQRVGVARALAADPPLMLMDEPFGALDPITRDHLQSEFQRLQERVSTTIVFVTHDIDEAIRLGDRIAILRDGQLVQYATPAELLVHPADAFVEEFVGADRALKRLSLLRASDAELEPAPAGNGAGDSIRDTAPLDDALAALLQDPDGRLTVVDAAGSALGVLTLESVHAKLRREAGAPSPG
jgi:osmoprotectant transport system ATP-binding protein